MLLVAALNGINVVSCCSELKKWCLPCAEVSIGNPRYHIAVPLEQLKVCMDSPSTWLMLALDVDGY